VGCRADDRSEPLKTRSGEDTRSRRGRARTIGPAFDSAAGSNVTSVVASRADERGPAWSPDGSKIAFYKSASDDSTDIWINDLASGTTTSLTRGRADEMFPDWSPNGRWIAYQSDRRSSAGDTRFHVWIKNIVTLAARQVTTGRGHQWHASWSPGGSQIAFDRYRIGDENIWTTTLKTGEAVRRTSGPAWAMLPVWSPDGTAIAFLSEDKICTLVIASGQITEVTNAGADGVLGESVEAWERI
jgi:Tol biopolymer transport system component